MSAREARIAEIETYLLGKKRLGSFYLDDVRELARYAREAVERPEGREGIVTVHDSMTGEYLGCMGVETWREQAASPPPAKENT